MARFRPRTQPSTQPRLRTRRSSPRRWLLSWWNLWRVPTLVTLVAAGWWFGVKPITDEQGWVTVEQNFSLCGEGPRTPGCVVDGDTVRIDTQGSRPRRIRLTGFDAAELDGACKTERALARQARVALAEWLAQGPFEWNGAADPPYDQYGRELRQVRRIRSDGTRDYLAQTMITRGLASDNGWGKELADWCA
ncbi:MAG: hypothetical protein AAFR64_06345 [Pseudomonadota bacterium]